MRIRTLIVDDEPLARRWLRERLSEDPDVEIAGEAADGEEAARMIESLGPDLVFLDVQMPGLDGFGALDSLDVPPPHVIFVTAHDEYAVRAFDVRALDYIVKPVDPARLREALRRFKGSAESRAPEHLSSLLAYLRAARGADRLLVKAGQRSIFVKIADIDWIESQRNSVVLHVGRSSYTYYETTSGVEAKLDPDQFLRIHRSAIVNIDRIKELQPLYNGDYRVTLLDDTVLTLSESYRHRLAEFRRLKV
jgi:two-component system LytT family response regulator